MTDDAALLRRLLAIEEIRRLKARYFRAIDQRDWDGLASVFAVGAVLEVPEVDAVLHGRDAIVSSVSAALAGARTVHHGHMPEIELTSDDTARGTWAMSDFVEWPPTDDGRRVGFRGSGHYEDRYVRDGGWRIAATRLMRLRVDPLDEVLRPPRER